MNSQAGSKVVYMGVETRPQGSILEKSNQMPNCSAKLYEKSPEHSSSSSGRSKTGPSQILKNPCELIRGLIVHPIFTKNHKHFYLHQFRVRSETETFGVLITRLSFRKTL